METKHPRMRKNYNNQAYRCPERLASLGIVGAQLRAFLKPHQHHRILVSSGLRGTLNRAPIIPRGVSVSDNRVNFLQT